MNGFADSFTLGLDLGANSVGWAMIADASAQGSPNILAGVRVFPEGTKKEKVKESPRNLKRREARQARRQHDRRARRKRKLLHVLLEHGVEPLVHERHGKTGPDEALPDPYLLRKRGLDEKLSLPEFGRALMHLNQRRGFRSNAKTDDPKETGKVKTQIGELSAKMEQNGARTLGEYLAGLDRAEERLRSRYTHRDMYENEFALLWESQAKHYPDVLTPELKAKVFEAVFHQRPLKPQDEKIGFCQLEKGERRCSRASWFAHQVRILQEVNNLRVLTPGCPERDLTPEERHTLVSKLQTAKELDVGGIKKTLKLRDIESVNFESTGRPKMQGNLVEWGVRKAFKEFKGDARKIEWLCREVFESLLGEDPADFQRKAKEEWQLTQEQIEDLYKVPRTPGYARLSRKAIEKVIPQLEKGLTMDKAILEAGYRDEALQEQVLLPPTPEEITNPVVRRAMSEARKVVNAIIREYGKPSRIVVELARETKGSIKERAERLSKNNAEHERHKQIEGQLREYGIEPTRDNILKYKLWKECEERCPYTGQGISFERLYRSGEIDIEHIYPYPRSYDDSFMNVTLCVAEENRARKKNKTPYEAYDGTPQYEEILVRVNRLKNMPYEKKRRFSAKRVPDDFVARQLNDTSYASREIRGHLQRLGVKVDTTRGPVTAQLRYCWGLNRILSKEGEGKTRDDHRHHAVDAAVIGLTSHGHLQALARKYDYRNPDVERFPAPWDGYTREEFRSEVAAAVKAINVSYRAERRVAGALHEETNYGRLSNGRYVHRVDLASITLSQVKRIVDPGVRGIVMGQLRSLGIDPDSSGAKIPKGAFEGLRMKTKNGRPAPAIRKVRICEPFGSAIAIKDKAGKTCRHVVPGGNHHVAVFEYVDEKGRTRTKDVVTRFDAAQRILGGKPAIQRTHPTRPDASFLFSLSINEMVLIPDDGGVERLYRVQTISDGPSEEGIDIRFRVHTAANIEDAKTVTRLCSLAVGKFNVTKVIVDPLGRIRRCHD